MADDTTLTELPVSTEDEVLSTPCVAGCGTTVTRTIPAGYTERAAKIMRGIPLMCAVCIDADERAQRDRERERMRRGREDRCLLPRGLRSLTWESYETHRKGAAGALVAAQALATGKHEKCGAMFVGPVGVGKTRLAATCAWAMLDRCELRYVNVADLMTKLTAAFGDGARAEALKVLTGRTALVLDDLDKINPTQTVLAHLYTAIDGRVQNGAPLIVTTNLMPGKLREKLARPGRGEDAEARAVIADSIVSRLLGHCTVHGIDGEDGRRS